MAMDMVLRRMKIESATVHASAHRPADHPAREQIDHGRYVEPALGRPDVGEIGDPLLVRPLGRELPVQKIRRYGRDLAITFVLRQTPAPWPRPQGLQAHQSFDPVQTAFDATRQQVMPDPPCPVGPVAGKEACLHLLAYGLVTSLGDRFSQAWKPERDTPIAWH